MARPMAANKNGKFAGVSKGSFQCAVSEKKKKKITQRRRARRGARRRKRQDAVVEILRARLPEAGKARAQDDRTVFSWQLSVCSFGEEEEKDNAETQSARRFAEKLDGFGGWSPAC
jgi:hypothetical protein